MTSPNSAEPIIEPDLPIIDAHHHLWFLPETAVRAAEQQDSLIARGLAPTFRRHARYLFDEWMTDLTSGHNVRASVFVEAHAMYRASGPDAMKSVGEVEFVNGVAAMADSGLFGSVHACAGIVGGVDLAHGEAIVESIIEAHVRAGGSRYRGVRSPVLYDEDARILGQGVGAPHLLLNDKFRSAFARLAQWGLSFDALILEPQLPDLIDLARSYPDVSIVLNHVGTPVGVGRYAGQREARFAEWGRNIRSLSDCANVSVKLGGLGMPLGGFPSYLASPSATSAQLVAEWRPYIDTSIEAFGVDRCMFASNFPVDSATCSYSTLWNVFKRVVGGASKDQKAALFSGTAKRVYRLDV